ncbi:hypothetical protein H0H93_010575, partial [Arthromyces matolae]
MLSNQLEEPSQFPWNKDGEWSDKVLRTVLKCVDRRQRKSVRKQQRLQAPGSKTASPDATKRTAASSSLFLDVSSSTFTQLNRSQLNSHMDILWEWAIQHTASLAKCRWLSAQKQLSGLNEERRRTISDKALIHLLLASVPPYNSARPNAMSKMPWHVEATFQSTHPDDVKKVLSHIWEKQRKWDGCGTSTLVVGGLNASPKILLEEMDKAWKWWADKRQTGKARC